MVNRGAVGNAVGGVCLARMHPAHRFVKGRERLNRWPTIGEECGIPEEPRRKVQWGSMAHNLLDDETKAEIIRLYRDEMLFMSDIAKHLNATRELPLRLTDVHVGRILEIANVRIRSPHVQGKVGGEANKRNYKKDDGQ